MLIIIICRYSILNKKESCAVFTLTFAFSRRMKTKKKSGLEIVRIKNKKKTYFAAHPACPGLLRTTSVFSQFPDHSL